MNSTFPFGFEVKKADLAAAITDHQVAIGATAALGAALLWYLTTKTSGDIKNIRGWPLIGHWKFFTK
jgi:hypothetical protein